jgi:hypothetical protein
MAAAQAIPYNPIVTHPQYNVLYDYVVAQVNQQHSLDLIPKRNINITSITLPCSLPRLSTHPYVAGDMVGLAMAQVMRARLQYDMPQYVFHNMIVRVGDQWKFPITQRMSIGQF